jgi:hypothetical protein
MVGADMKFIAALVATSVAIVSPAVTRADAGAPSVEPVVPIGPAPVPAVAEAPVENGRWYGWELIVSDTLFLMLADDRGHETGLGKYGLPLGLLGVAVGAPALHWIHGNRRRAGFGLLVRGLTVTLFEAAVLSGGGGGQCSGDSCGGPDSGDFVLVGLAFVSIAGAVAYAFIDDFWFSNVPVQAAPRPRGAIVPTAYVRPGGGGLGLVGAF